jgi:hypothetical protein
MWTTEIKIGFPIWIILILIFFTLSIVGIVWWIKRRSQEAGFVAVMAPIFLVIMIGGGLWGLYPYQAEYHQWKTVSGVVTAKGDRLLSNGYGSDQKYVVVINDQEWGCLDTRCDLVKPGDSLTLKCKRVKQESGTDGYDCNYVSWVSSHAKKATARAHK